MTVQRTVTDVEPTVQRTVTGADLTVQRTVTVETPDFRGQ